MHIDFSGQRALVTGGTRGIGAAIVRGLVAAGARVTATGRDPEGVARLRAACTPGVDYQAVDFADSVAAEAFAQTITSQEISVLVNNAGINRIALTGDVDMDDWDRIQRVNLRAPMLLCRALAPGMAARGYGRIVNVTSIFGHVSRAKRVSYSTSKFGLSGLTRALALDYAERNVLVNGLAPGFVDTELTRATLSEQERSELAASIPMKRFANVDDIARSVMFLASAANTYVTGQNLIVDGGFTSV